MNDLCNVLGRPLVVRERENLGGVRMHGDSDVIYVEPVECPTRQVYETVLLLIQQKETKGGVDQKLVEDSVRVSAPFLQYLLSVNEECAERNSSSGTSAQRLYHGTTISNASILTRLISFASGEGVEVQDDTTANLDCCDDTVVQEGFSQFLQLSRFACD